MVPKRSILWHALNGTYTRSDRNRHIAELERLTRQATITKPERMLGAPWIDRFVALRRIVFLCEDCHRKYFGWWTREDYQPAWGRHNRTDCDGCGERLKRCLEYHPLETSKLGTKPSLNIFGAK